MKKFELGNHSESIVLGAYLKEGFTVSIPFGSGASYDLLIDTGSNIYKIQVKTAWISKGVLKYKCLRRRPKSETRRLYKESEVDFLAVYSPANDELYGIPIKNHPNNVGWLRIAPVRNGQAKKIRWASDYTWEKHIAELKNEYARQELNLRPFGSEPNALSTELRARKKHYGINSPDSQQI
jgi:hypothetical protein